MEVLRPRIQDELAEVIKQAEFDRYLKEKMKGNLGELLPFLNQLTRNLDTLVDMKPLVENPQLLKMVIEGSPILDLVRDFAFYRIRTGEQLLIAVSRRSLKEVRPDIDLSKLKIDP